ncbi:phage tail protein [Serratia fonticola]|uniref:phage tail protein n=1 Tax=Serratia fonticola TaxID=47917 RepID=UPI000BFE22C4|nr:phage tail protein [Serratia fonticola]ATM78769.1 phage tail protein [Serratia fonticola]
MILGFGNNIRSALAADINSTQTVIAVMPGTGALFAKTLQADASLVNPSYACTLYAKLTLTDELETVFEICHLVSVSGDNLTVIRGQELTKAKGWSLNDVVSNFPTRGSENNFVQIEDLQSGKYLSATAGGSANALTVSIPSTFYVNGGNTFALRSPLLVTPTLTNTGAVTVQLTVSGRVVGTYPVVKGGNTPLIAGDIIKDVPLLVMLSSALSAFVVVNPVTGVFSSTDYLRKDQNLADVPDKAKARENLGIPDCPHLVGDVIFRANNISPVTSYPGTTWTDLNASYGSSNIMIGGTPLSTGGSDSVTLGVVNLPSHSHGFSGSSGGAGAHSHGLRSYRSNTALDGGSSNRESIDITTPFNTSDDLISSVGDHTHTISGTIGNTGSGQSFSVVSKYVQLRAWMRTA